MRALLGALFLCLSLWPIHAGQAGLSAQQAAIVEMIRESGAEVVGVAVHDLQTGKQLLIDERVSVHAASTMKVPVMMEIFRLASAGKLRLDDRMAVENRFTSIVDGSEYRLREEDDSDSEVYRRIGQGMTIIELVDRMITWSSNLATNLLIEKARPARVNELMRRLGARDIQVRRGVEDAKAFQAGLNNTTTAYDLMLVFRAIAEAKLADRAGCEKMIEILAAQHFNQGIPAGLPAGIRVAHKTGEITRHNHDAGIVYPPGRRPYVVVVLTRGIAERERSDRLIADISRLVYQSLATSTQRR